jgi:hypothetical protein
MERRSVDEAREIRAARNQALFRAVNERLKEMNEAFEQLVGSHAIACECADATCIETLVIAPDEYDQVRAHPRRFVVCPGHVVPDVEAVVHEGAGYEVVEKLGTAGEVAEAEQLA